jgi:hypothetical protein
MILHPLQKIVVESKTLTMAKYLPKTVSGVLDQIGDKIISVSVAISQKSQ